MQVLVERPCATSFHIFAKRFGTSSLLAKRLAIISFFAFFFFQPVDCQLENIKCDLRMSPR